MKGGEGKITVNGCSSGPLAASPVGFVIPPQPLREMRKYGDREMSINWWEEKMTVASLVCADEKVPEREIRISE